MKICFASSNQGKVDEINNLLPSSIEIVGLKDLDVIDDIPETGDTFQENALQKASYIFDRFRIPVFADDSGLCVTALEDEPGVFSARYAGVPKDDKKNIQLLLENLDTNSQRSAYFKTVIAYIDQNGNEYFFEGSVLGDITLEEKGKNGFGYDPVFTPKGYDQTFAELSKEVKNQISHRSIAVKKLINYLSSNT